MTVIDNLRNELANLPPGYAIAMEQTTARNRDALRNLLTGQLGQIVATQATQIANQANQLGNQATQIANQANQLGNQANQIANQAQQINTLANQVGMLNALVIAFTQRLALYRNRILPGVIGLSVAWTLAQAAMHYFGESGPDAPAGTEETCKKALQECQSGLVRNKDLLDKCIGFIPTLKLHRDKAMDDLGACLNELEAREEYNKDKAAFDKTVAEGAASGEKYKKQQEVDDNMDAEIAAALNIKRE